MVTPLGYELERQQFQLRCDPQAVFGDMAPSSHALGILAFSALGDSVPPRRDKTLQWWSAYLNRRIGRASTPGYRWELVGFRAWRPLLANYRKPAPAFVKQRLKFDGRRQSPARRRTPSGTHEQRRCCACRLRCASRRGWIEAAPGAASKPPRPRRVGALCVHAIGGRPMPRLRAFRLSRRTLSLPVASNRQQSRGQAMSDRVLFSVGGPSAFLVLATLAMFVRV